MKIEFDDMEDVRAFIQFILCPQLALPGPKQRGISADILKEADKVLEEGKKWKQALREHID